MSRRSGIKREALHLEGPTLGYAAMTELAKKVGVVTPFVTWPIMIVAGALLRAFWPANFWVITFLGIASVFFAGFVWYLTHDRKGLASEHAAFTALAYGTILSMVDYIGWNRVTGFLMLFGVGFICCTWSVRNAIRHHDESQGSSISSLFETAGMEGTKMHVKPKPNENRKRWSLPWSRKAAEPEGDESDRTGKQRRKPATKKRDAKILLKPGETVDDLIKRVGKLESAAGVPPGTFLITKDLDNAQRADAVISDPRAIKKPIPYPGPSYMGASIADPISTGLYQDGSEQEWDIPGLQIQVMGMTGSGKSLGAGWSALAEIITRKDVIVWGIDITKGEQTLGPLGPALHRLATTPAEAMKMLEDVNRLIKPRTNYLSAKGLGKWKRGCGLQYLVVWMEEVPDIIEAIDDEGEELWIKSVKAARSAGITFVWSLQRADYSQIPTITRGQAAKWCFGVADSHEASFGLSTIQDSAGCEPELWANRQPGMNYLDAPSIPENLVPTRGRTWYWGKDDTLIRAHAEKYPASDRPYDEVMLQVLDHIPAMSTPVKREPVSVTVDKSELDSEVEEVLNDSDLDEELADLDNDVTFKREKVDPLPPVAARALVRNWLVERAGQTVKNVDLNEVRKRTGYGRGWGYKVMDEFVSTGLVRRIDSNDGVSWVVTNLQSILSQED